MADYPICKACKQPFESNEDLLKRLRDRAEHNLQKRLIQAVKVYIEEAGIGD